jgi:hypothetical protein
MAVMGRIKSPAPRIVNNLQKTIDKLRGAHSNGLQHAAMQGETLFHRAARIH